jgi:hypothetical protein
MCGFGLVCLHAVISLVLYRPAYYPDFFEDSGKLAFKSELSVLCAILAVFIFSIIAFRYKKILSYIAFILVMLHVSMMGYEKWFKPADWPGRLPPMTLLALIAICFVLFKKALANIDNEP